MKTTRSHASVAGGKSSPKFFARKSLAARLIMHICTHFCLFFIVVLAAGFFAIVPASAASPSDLNALETRFFEHTYPQDTTEDRLSRLEKMVFGEARTGDTQDRLTQLVNAVPPPAASSDNQTQAQASGGGSGAQNAAAGNSTGANGADDSDTSSGTDYPRVTELEKALLGKSYQGEPIKHRLDQLELKAFKKTHSGEDLADRVDRIAQYADKKFNGNQNSAFAQGEPRNGSVEEKVAWLETQIEGQSFPQKPMIERLRPLEKAMFPTDPTDIHASIPEQVNMLMSAVELLHKQQTGQASSSQELSIAPLVQGGQQAGYARQNNYQSDLQREFQEDNGPAPAQNPSPSYSPNYRPQQAYSGGYSQPAYTQSQGYGSQQYAQQPAYTQAHYSQPATQASNSTQQSHGHPFFRGLAKALGTVGSMVGSSMMSGGMMNFGSGYGGYGMGMPGYGMGNGGAVFGFP